MSQKALKVDFLLALCETNPSKNGMKLTEKKKFFPR